MINLLKYQSIKIDDGVAMNKQKWIEIWALIATIAAITALGTFCLTEYNIQLDCKTIGAFRVDGEGFKCAEVQK